MSGELRVGCSGWSYPDWRGTVYPADAPTDRWFTLYARRFDTVELNTTFYRLPEPATVEHWRDAAPPGFCFAVKVGQFGSHRKKLRDPSAWLANHLDRVERLGPHLGPNLVQLPPRWKRNPARLDEFLDAAPSRLRWAVELRDETWIHDDVFDVLSRHDAALCLHDLLPDQPWERTASWTYVRFHGPRATTDRYRGRYGRRRLEPIAERLARWRDAGVDVYAYFNNDFDGHAVTDAEELRALLDAADGVPPGWTPPPNWAPWPEDHRPTGFQCAVIESVSSLRPGDVVSYGDVAHEIGRPGSGQAVANVLRHAPDLPWWRVVPADGRLYRTHERRQRPLLEQEGHVVDGDRRIVTPDG